MLGRLTATLIFVGAVAVACDIKRGDQVAEPEPAPARDDSRPSEAPAPPPSRRSLEGTAAPATKLDVGTLQKVDVAQALTNGEVTIEANDPGTQTGVPALFDGSTESLARTNGINPLVLTLTFKQPIHLRAARVHLAASPYDWVLEALPGDSRLLATGVPEREWSQIDLSEAVETSVVRLELLRLERDDHVHANEIELYAEPTS